MITGGKMKVHKTCETWGVTQCWKERWSRSSIKTTLRWENTTCSKCLAARGINGPDLHR